MNKNEVKKLFWNLVNGIEFCCDTITENSAGVVVERGMALENDYSAMYVLDEGSIRIYDNHHNESKSEYNYKCYCRIHRR